MPKSKSCKKTIAISINRTNEEVERLYIASKKQSNPSTETGLFPLGDRDLWEIKPGVIGTYHLYYKGDLMYVGQGILVTRVGKNLREHQQYFKLGLKKAKLKTSKERWSVSPKLYNVSKQIKNWKVQFVSFDTGNIQLDKIHAKNHEDVMIETHEPPLNCKIGDNT